MHHDDKIGVGLRIVRGREGLGDLLDRLVRIDVGQPSGAFPPGLKPCSTLSGAVLSTK
jgi:hypothetical protein